jgi:hypothetical protein
LQWYLKVIQEKHHINVPRDETTRLASNHLPLCAELLLDNRKSGVPAAD